ncbi:MAG TPA: hypothetical protein VIQ80_02470 [Candidatus Saccharimonadales bacterium]
MIVQIIGSTKNIEEDIRFYSIITDVIHDHGAVVARDWISAAQSRLAKGIVRDNTKIEWADVHKENSEAISRSDVVIIEATNYGFPEGFYVSQALNQKKPILIVTRENIRGRLMYGIKHKLLSVQHYDSQDDLRKIVSKFIKDNTIATKDLRFNFFIDRQIYNYLREASYETGKNKSEIIRELLEQEIDKQEQS